MRYITWTSSQGDQAAKPQSLIGPVSRRQRDRPTVAIMPFVEAGTGMRRVSTIKELAVNELPHVATALHATGATHRGSGWRVLRREGREISDDEDIRDLGLASDHRR